MVTAAVVAGFMCLILGFFLGKRATEWCRHCGWRLTADHCRNLPAVEQTRQPGGAVWADVDGPRHSRGGPW
jgi:hypothetical protein